MPLRSMDKIFEEVLDEGPTWDNCSSQVLTRSSNIPLADLGIASWGTHNLEATDGGTSKQAIKLVDRQDNVGKACPDSDASHMDKVALLIRSSFTCKLYMARKWQSYGPPSGFAEYKPIVKPLLKTGEEASEGHALYYLFMLLSSPVGALIPARIVKPWCITSITTQAGKGIS